MPTDAPTAITEIASFIRTQFDVAADDPDFGPGVHLFDYGYLDSFGAQTLIEHLEKTYAIQITDADLVKYPLNTVSEIGKFVVDRQTGAR